MFKILCLRAEGIKTILFGIPENVAEKAACFKTSNQNLLFDGKSLTEIFRLITVIQDGVKSDTITCIIHDHTSIVSSCLQARHFDK